MKLLGIFIEYPWAALAVASAFAVLWYFRRRRTIAVAAVLWSGYGVYEYLMHARVLCSGECNIRVDLLLLYPVLFVISIAAAAVSLRRNAV